LLQQKILFAQVYNTDMTITIHRFSVILKDDIEISRSIPHTKTLCPGDDYSEEDADTQKMCKALWIKSVVDAYKQIINDQLAKDAEVSSPATTSDYSYLSGV